MKSIFLRLVGLVIFCGCTVLLPPREVKLVPQLQLPPTNLGNAKRLFVTVVDERPQKHLGYQVGSTFEGAVLTPSEPVEVVVQKSLSGGFSSMGFEVAPERAETESALEIRVTSLEYSFDTSRRGHDSEVVAAAKMRVVRGRSEIYSKEYKTFENFRVVFRPSSVKDEKLNAVLSDLLLMILGDLDLVAAVQSDAMHSTAAATSDPGRETAIKEAVDTQELARFYEGKTMRFVLGFPGPSEVDHSSRQLVSHFRKHIGELMGPEISVENILGFESLIVARYITERAEADALTIAGFAGEPLLWRDLESTGRFKFDWRKLEWIGGLESTQTKKRIFYAISAAAPKERVRHLRGAFTRMARDPAFLAAVGAAMMPLTAEEVTSLAGDFYKAQAGER